ncbi:phosphoribosyltransferase family protein [Flavobacteriaceae bacterium]|nr:phosphoribosyltransferase family protein [Flavobacteriaceae bacterium]
MPGIEFGSHLILSPKELAFSADDYSKFKYGDSSIGYKYGEELFRNFLNAHGASISKHNKILVFSSPFQFIPTASWTIAVKFYELMKAHFRDKEIVFSKIERNVTYTEDYGNLSSEQRLALISNDTFSLNETIDKNDLLILIDDIKITGSHEMVVDKTFINAKYHNPRFFLYHAILKNPDISPNFENHLNYHFVKSPEQILQVIKSEAFLLNTRITKHLLSLKQQDLFYILENTDETFIKNVIRNAVGNNYHLIDEYEANLNLLKEFLNSCVQSI